MTVGAISSADPMALPGEFYKQPVGGNTDTRSKTLRNPLTIPKPTTGVFVVVCQSNGCNVTPTATTVTNTTKVHNLNVYDGAIYAAADPLVGCQNIPRNPGIGNVFTRMADKLVSDGKYTDVILVPVGIGGTAISEWVTDASLNTRALVGARRAAALGFSVNAFLFMQGESDNALGNSQAGYAASLASFIAVPRSFGFNAPWLIGKCTYNLGTVSAAVQAAQFGIANGTNIFNGADTDSLTGMAVYRQIDDTHLTDAGRNAAGDLWAARVEAVI